jgi:hypothetical protein
VSAVPASLGSGAALLEPLWQNNLNIFKDFRTENGSSQGQDLALTVLCAKFSDYDRTTTSQGWTQPGLQFEPSLGWQIRIRITGKVKVKPENAQLDLYCRIQQSVPGTSYLDIKSRFCTPSLLVSAVPKAGRS